jgi:predicted GNAT superfamily acetyltransferase
VSTPPDADHEPGGSYTIRDLFSREDYQACAELQRITWGSDFNELVPQTILRLAQRLGGVAAGAFDEQGALLGFVFGLTGLEQGRPVHWSDMLAVHPRARNRGIGESLKKYQRERLLESGITHVRWTFDPLESRNAFINFVRLGVTSRDYRREFYADSCSPLHAGIGTDRLIVDWQLDSARVRDRLSKEQTTPVPADNGPIVTPVAVVRGWAHSSSPRLDDDSALLRIAIPLDIQTLKAEQPELALNWRLHTRAAFEHYLSRSYEVTDYQKGEELGFYVLARRPLLA